MPRASSGSVPGRARRESSAILRTSEGSDCLRKLGGTAAPCARATLASGSTDPNAGHLGGVNREKQRNGVGKPPASRRTPPLLRSSLFFFRSDKSLLEAAGYLRRRRRPRKSSENAAAISHGAIRPIIDVFPIAHQLLSLDEEVSVPVPVWVAVPVAVGEAVLVWVPVAVPGTQRRHA